VTRSRLIERSVSAAILLGVAAGLVGVVYVKSGLFNVAALTSAQPGDGVDHS